MRVEKKRSIRNMSVEQLKKRLNYLRSKLKPNQPETRHIKYARYQLRSREKG